MTGRPTVNRLVLATALALAIHAAAVVPGASADCDGPYPSFREVAPTARRVVYGIVTATRPGPADWGDGRTSRFTIQGWALNEGPRPDVVEVRDVVSQPCAGYLAAGPGEKVVVALDGVAFSPRVAANAIAWVDARAPDVIGI